TSTVDRRRPCSSTMTTLRFRPLMRRPWLCLRSRSSITRCRLIMPTISAMYPLVLAGERCYEPDESGANEPDDHPNPENQAEGYAVVETEKTVVSAALRFAALRNQRQQQGDRHHDDRPAQLPRLHALFVWPSSQEQLKEPADFDARAVDRARIGGD